MTPIELSDILTKTKHPDGMLVIRHKDKYFKVKKINEFELFNDVTIVLEETDMPDPEVTIKGNEILEKLSQQLKGEL